MIPAVVVPAVMRLAALLRALFTIVVVAFTVVVRMTMMMRMVMRAVIVIVFPVRHGLPSSILNVPQAPRLVVDEPGRLRHRILRSALNGTLQ
jgi:hypothetical protein